MIKELTLELFLELPDKIIKVAKEQNNYINLLSSDLINEYYYTNLRKDLSNYFNNFNDSKYLFTFNYPDTIYNTANLNENVVSKNNKINDKINNYITKKIDKEIWSRDFYNSIISLSYKLTYNEAYYFVNTFFAKNTEDEISEILDMSRNTLQKIKRSCLVKCYLELKYNENLNLKLK